MTPSGIYINGGFFSWNGFAGYRSGDGFVYLVSKSGREVMILPEECEKVLKNYLTRI